MLITSREAARALACGEKKLIRAYTGDADMNVRGTRYVVDSELLCAAVGLDPRFLMAFLCQYDAALKRPEVLRMLNIRKHYMGDELPIKPVADLKHLEKSHIWRYSHRQVAVYIDAQERASGKYKPRSACGGSILPPPNTLPRDTWTFRSSIETDGIRLPCKHRAGLASGLRSTLPVLDSSE